jgi:hypothetical protein
MSSILRGYDIDGTLTTGLKPLEPYVIISGRTLAEYNAYARTLASQAPLYIRCTGNFGDRTHAGTFKAQMINLLGVTEFYEDDDAQIALIRAQCPSCKVYKVLPDASIELMG